MKVGRNRRTPAPIDPKRPQPPAYVVQGFQRVPIGYSDSMSEDTYGLYRKDPPEIHLSRGLTLCDELNTILHELTHALFDTFGITEVDSSLSTHEEFITKQLANGWVELFVRNPDLFSYVVKSVRIIRREQQDDE